MGKLFKLQRSRPRMTDYNISKAWGVLEMIEQQSQERHNIRHENIVKLLQERYKTKLDKLSESYQSQIDMLKSELKSSSHSQSKRTVYCLVISKSLYFHLADIIVFRPNSAIFIKIDKFFLYLF